MQNDLFKEDYYENLAKEQIIEKNIEEQINENINKISDDLIRKTKIIKNCDCRNINSILEIETQINQIKENLDEIKSEISKIAPKYDYNELITQSNINQIKFEQVNEYLHIIFPTLLPRRLKGKNDIYSYQDIYMKYYADFFNYFSQNGKHLIYDKAVLIYTHFFENESQLVDHDNFETKKITDMITSWILPDDNPKFCSQFFRYKLGDYKHTEIEVIPQKRFIEYYENETEEEQ